MNPRVSVLMITYKHEMFIEQAVNSILEQITNFDYELIIANDNSPDSTHEVVTKLIKNHPKSGLINYFKNEINLGPNANYIKAYNSGKGEYIAVCEGDDFWGDEFKLQKQVDFLDQNPEYVLTYHDANCINENGLTLDNISNGRPPKEFSKLELKKGYQPLFLTTCYRRLPIELFIEMENIINGDTFLTSILGNYGKGKWLDIKPAYYRHHSGGVWSLKQKEYKFKAKIQLFSVLKKHYKSKKSQDLVDYFNYQLSVHKRMLLSLYFKEFNYVGLIKYALNQNSGKFNKK